METQDNYQPPKADKSDLAHSIARAGISLIPYAGGSILEIFNYLLVPPIEKRKEAWMNEIANGLRKLEKKCGIQLEDLQNNEAFTTILIQATNSFIRCHQIEKKEALRNAVINTALGVNIKDETKELFIRYVDNFIPSHLLLLSYLIRNEQTLYHKKSYSELFQELDICYPGYLNKDEFRMIFNDLSSHGLIRISQELEDAKDLYSEDIVVTGNSELENLPPFIVTLLGKDFINFITEEE